MSENEAVTRHGKPVRSMLAVQCGRRTANGRLGGQEPSGRAELQAAGVQNQNSVWRSADFEFLARDDIAKVKDDQQVQTLTELATGGRLEVQLLDCPTKDELRQKLEAVHPDILVFLGEHVPETSEIGPLLLGDSKVSSPDVIKSMFSTNLPELIYFEVPAAGRLAEVLHDMGVLHVIFWKSSVTLPLAIQFRQALLAALKIPGCGVWEAFQLAKASFQMHCSQVRFVGLTNGQQHLNPVQPMILGNPQELSDPPKMDSGSEEGSASTGYPIIQVFDDEVELRLLVCVEACTSDMKQLRSIEDGLGALLAIEARGVRLIHRISAPPPPTASFARGVVTMRCDLCTSSSARVSFLVSGSAQTCFDDQLLESSIRKELIEKSSLIHLINACGEDNSITQAELRRSVSVACGAAVVELRLKTSAWALQALRQLSTEPGYCSLVALGIAGVEGAPVAAFQKEDAERLASLKPEQTAKAEDSISCTSIDVTVPWLVPAEPVRKRHLLYGEKTAFYRDSWMINGLHHSWQPLTNFSDHVGDEGNASKQRALLLAAMKPIPHTSRRKLVPFAGVVTAGAYNGWSMKMNPNGSTGRIRSAAGTFVSGADPSSWLPLNSYKQTSSNAASAPFIIPIPAMVKKHDCNRSPISECSEADFMEDVMQFLISRGHVRLVPPTGVEAFPDAVLNGKRLDLYNLYREVVTRGGFRVGNGINWKGQVFAKMRNHTLTNKMTGVGNTLKKHYEIYLLEYELAHDDVGGDCCIICHSGAEGDWVNCGMCGEWAHFGCDRRVGLGSFKDYSKTDGLDYICPRCSVANLRGIPGRKKSRISIDGHPSLAPSLSRSTQKRAH